MGPSSHRAIRALRQRARRGCQRRRVRIEVSPTEIPSRLGAATSGRTSAHQPSQSSPGQCLEDARAGACSRRRGRADARRPVTPRAHARRSPSTPGAPPLRRLRRYRDRVGCRACVRPPPPASRALRRATKPAARRAAGARSSPRSCPRGINCGVDDSQASHFFEFFRVLPFVGRARAIPRSLVWQPIEGSGITVNADLTSARRNPRPDEAEAALGSVIPPDEGQAPLKSLPHQPPPSVRWRI